MASKNSRKIDVEDTYYHVYNRGVEKRTIFKDDQDYKVFVRYLNEYLSPPEDLKYKKAYVTVQDRVFKGVPRKPKNYHSEIQFIAYSLMPNHFHFLIKQIKKGSMEKLLHSLLLRYSMYFNKKYKRVGPLFQGRYKAVIIDTEEYLLHLSRYIHLNPSENFEDPTKAYSSLSDFLELKKTPWIKPEIILSYFNKQVNSEFIKTDSYKSFIFDYKVKNDSLLETLFSLSLEDEEG